MGKSRIGGPNPRPCGVLLYKARPSIEQRLKVLVKRIKNIRSNLYPKDWEHDPFREIVRELQNMIEDI